MAWYPIKGGENVTPEVTAQTELIESIAKEFDVSITTPSGTNKNKLQTNNENLSKIKNGASTNVINGILEEYYAESGTIDANTFVEFAGKIKQTYIGYLTYTEYGFSFNAVKINDNTVLFVRAASTYIDSWIIKLKKDSAVLYPQTQLTVGYVINSTNQNGGIPLIKCSDTDYLCVFGFGTYNPSSNFSGVHFSVDLTANLVTYTFVTLNNRSDSFITASNFIELSENKFLLVHTSNIRSESYKTKASVIQFNPSTKKFSLESIIILFDGHRVYKNAKLIELSLNRFAVLGINGSYPGLITFDLDASYSNASNIKYVQLSTLTYSEKETDICKIENNKLIAFTAGDSNARKTLKAIFISILSDGTANIDTTIESAITSSYKIDYTNTIYSNGILKILVSSLYSYHYAYCFTMNVGTNSLTQVSKETIYAAGNSSDEDYTMGDVQYKGQTFAYLMIPFSINTVFIISGWFSSSYGRYLGFKRYKDKTTISKSIELIDGLTKNKISETASGKVWALKGE